MINDDAFLRALQGVPPGKPPIKLSFSEMEKLHEAATIVTGLSPILQKFAPYIQVEVDFG